VFVIVIILEAKLNGMFFLICFGWLDLKLRYIWVSVSFEKMSVIMLLFVDIQIKMSKNGISILLLFMVKRMWSFKELSSVWKISNIFSKDTDTHMYINFRSSNPKHIKKNIPFNLASRIITITNTEELRDTRLRELRLYLKNQQYPEEIVEHGIQKALKKGPIHTELREQVHVTSNQNNIIPFVTTYNPRDCNIFHFMKQIEFNLNSSERMTSLSILKCKRGSFY
jgi:hypothetical protein